MSENYNCNPGIFREAREHYKTRKIFLVVVEGHIIAGRDAVVARFTNDVDAENCLIEAGYTRDPHTENKIYHP